MFAANVRIIEELKEFVSLVSQTPEILKVFSTQPCYFTRNRKLPFNRLVLMIMQLCKKTLSVELERFFKESARGSSCSVSAFSQQRAKLSPVFFKVWNQLLYSSYYKYHTARVKRWKGWRLIAADGSNVSLVKTPALERYYGGQRNQKGTFVQAKTFYFYDVLNGLIVHSQLSPYRTAELTIAYNMIQRIEQDMLMIYDRNFCNYKMFALHMWGEKEMKFLIRGNETKNFVKSFIKTGKQSAVIHLAPSPYAIAGLYQDGYKITKNTLIKLRLIRVQLPTCVEVLITNLWEQEGYCHDEFKDIYNKRWAIETNIYLQKNILQLESFSGLSPLSIEQDFYATVFVTNLYSIIIKDAQSKVDTSYANRKYAMKINGNKAWGKLKAVLVKLFLNNKPIAILHLLYRAFIRAPLPIRPNRTFPRIIKNKQSNSKHKTFMNYKPAY